MLIIEVCRTQSNWARVYKNRRAYNAGKMFFETSSRSGHFSRSDRQIARDALKVMVEIFYLVHFDGAPRRDFEVLVISEDDTEKKIKIFA
jgi:hypothetical protein